MSALDTLNATILPSAHDLLMVFPRLAQRAFHLAERLDGFLGMVREPGTVIADPTVSGSMNASIANTTKFIAQPSTSVKIATQSASTSLWDCVKYIKSMGGIFNYVFSKWSIVTFAIVSYPTASKRWPRLTGIGNFLESNPILRLKPHSSKPKMAPSTRDLPPPNICISSTDISPFARHSLSDLTELGLDAIWRRRQAVLH